MSTEIDQMVSTVKSERRSIDDLPKAFDPAVIETRREESWSLGAPWNSYETLISFHLQNPKTRAEMGDRTPFVERTPSKTKSFSQVISIQSRFDIKRLNGDTCLR
ncbi:unnamed protein product [Porites evermanni]|uniref:Uncharacterized protein n=1 Tax=Porites evermanni TaxID=104178 RepID=A0ABN8Q076_9CNID|nr:unnamed protein product [Porites evermanni]